MMTQDSTRLSAQICSLISLLKESDESLADALERIVVDSTVAHLARMPPVKFEKIVGRALEAQGYTVRHVGGRGDRGIDLVAERDGEMVAVQCKRYDNAPVTPTHVREFLGAMVAFGATRGVFVTTSVFTPAARTVCPESQIELVDSAALGTWLVRDRSRLRARLRSRCGSAARTTSEWTKAWVCSSCNHLNWTD